MRRTVSRRTGDKSNFVTRVALRRGGFDTSREKRAYFLAHPMIPNDVLANGIRRMQTEAKQTMELVREKTGLSYSLDLFVDNVDIFGNEG